MADKTVVNNLQAEIEVDAPPEKVWALVSDLSAMARWSPQTFKTFLRGSGKGAKMININKAGWRVWPTTSMIKDFEPNKRLMFKVRENKAQWSYDLEPLDGGSRTKIVETRDVSGGTSGISHFLVDKFFGGNTNFESVLQADMTKTLQRIKTEVESS